MQQWRMHEWIYTHETHGTFFVSVYEDGSARAVRVWEGGELAAGQINVVAGRHLERIGGVDGMHKNVGSALIACEQRLGELEAGAARKSA